MVHANKELQHKVVIYLEDKWEETIYMDRLDPS